MTPSAAPTAGLDTDWRFAELVLLSHLDPELERSYRQDPHGTLARFGLSATDAPDLATGSVQAGPLAEVDLLRVTANPSICWVERPPAVSAPAVATLAG